MMFEGRNTQHARGNAMSKSFDCYNEWAEYDGAIVWVEGLRCELQSYSYEARYPYARQVLIVRAFPTKSAQKTESYRHTKRELGDDWSFDVLDMDVEAQEGILRQVA
jgi:hypothetical protein